MREHNTQLTDPLRSPSTPAAQPQTRRASLTRFYELLDDLEQRVGGKRTLADCTGRMKWPKRGVYFFFEPEEERSGSGSGPRVTRVGTHALKSGARTTLWNRLSQHRGVMKHGGGNHRGSVFRLLVGAALMRRNPDLYIESWGRGRWPPSEAAEREHPMECRVSNVIRAMPFLWLPVPDEPGPQSLRGFVERNAIALLSGYAHEAVDPPSDEWLGSHCPRNRVRDSGLWNNNHVHESCSPAFLDTFARLVAETGKGGADAPGTGARNPRNPEAHDPRSDPCADLRGTLIIIPCSKAKKALPDADETGRGIAEHLSHDCATALSRARGAIRDDAQIDESTRAAAWRRYNGYFYRAAKKGLEKATAAGLHVLILSGGYGVLLATEPIGNYDMRLKLRLWPRDLLENVIGQYARHHGLTQMRAFVSRSSSYRTLATRVKWRAAGVETAVLFVPERSKGAMLKAPRAQGEAFAALIDGKLDSSWRSSDGLRLCREELA